METVGTKTRRHTNQMEKEKHFLPPFDWPQTSGKRFMEMHWAPLSLIYLFI
jgi:hypothetical protein